MKIGLKQSRLSTLQVIFLDKSKHFFSIWGIVLTIKKERKKTAAAETDKLSEKNHIFMKIASPYRKKNETQLSQNTRADHIDSE